MLKANKGKLIKKVNHWPVKRYNVVMKPWNPASGKTN